MPLSDKAPDYIVTVPGLDDAILETYDTIDTDMVALLTDWTGVFRFEHATVLRVNIHALDIDHVDLALTPESARCLHTALGHMLGTDDDPDREEQ